MAYVYRHIRLDKNEPFYIGIGSDENYKRAHDKHKRSTFWKRIANKAEYEVEILVDGLTWEQACEKEKEFIAIYGRINNGGTLCNITLGGEGAWGVKQTEENKKRLAAANMGNKYNLGKIGSLVKRRKISEANKKRVYSDETKAKISQSMKGRFANEKNPNYGKTHSAETRKKISEALAGKQLSGSKSPLFKGYVEVYKDGELIGTFEGNSQASKYLNVDQRSVSACVLGKRNSHKGYTFKRLAA